MVTKRTPIRRDNVVKITSELLDTYAAVSETYGDDAREAEYYEAATKLHKLLGRKPWQEEIQNTFGADVPPSYIIKAGEFRVNDWNEAHAIRAQLDEALQQRGT